MDCKHYNIGIISIESDTPHSCSAKNNIEFEAWWQENGKKTDRSTLTEMTCFKETKLGEIHNDLISLLNKLGERLDVINKEKPNE